MALHSEILQCTPKDAQCTMTKSAEHFPDGGLPVRNMSLSEVSLKVVIAQYRVKARKQVQRF